MAAWRDWIVCVSEVIPFEGRTPGIAPEVICKSSMAKWWKAAHVHLPKQIMQVYHIKLYKIRKLSEHKVNI